MSFSEEMKGCGECWDHVPPEVLANWPNCSVPDCEYKACNWLRTGMCYPHSNGKSLKSIEVFPGEIKV